MPSVVGEMTKGAVFDKIVTVTNTGGTAHRLLYTGADGVVNELAYGSAGQHLKSEGTTTAPTWETPSAGVTTILGLTDTPSSYTGNEGKFLRVNQAPDAMDFVTLTEAMISDLTHYTSGDFATDFDGSSLADLGSKSHSDLDGVGADDHHSRAHSMTGTSDHDAGTDKVFYSDGSGDVQELTLGASGTYLKSQGTGSAPMWDTPAGGGGTPPFDDDTAILRDSADNTKLWLVDCGSITTATTRTWVVPDVSDTFVGLAAAQAITGKTSIAVDNLTLDGNAITATSGGITLDAVAASSIVVNDAGANVDFVVKSDGYAAMFGVDANANTSGRAYFGAIQNALVSITGQADETQLHVRGKSGQIAELVRFENYDGSVASMSLLDTGDVIFAGTVVGASVSLSAHAARHLGNGSDAMSASATGVDGLCPGLPAADPTLKYLRGDGTWVALPGGGDVLASGTLTDDYLVMGSGGVTVEDTGILVTSNTQLSGISKLDMSAAIAVLTAGKIQCFGDNDSHIDFGTPDRMDFQIGGVDQITLDATAAQDAMTVNPDAADVDFVIRGDTETAIFGTDAGEDSVYVGDDTLTTSGLLTVVGVHQDRPALLVRGWSTQTTSVFKVQNNAATDLFKVGNAGSLTAAGNLTLGASGTIGVASGSLTLASDLACGGTKTITSAALISVDDLTLNGYELSSSTSISITPTTFMDVGGTYVSFKNGTLKEISIIRPSSKLDLTIDARTTVSGIVMDAEKTNGIILKIDGTQKVQLNDSVLDVVNVLRCGGMRIDASITGLAGTVSISSDTLAAGSTPLGTSYVPDKIAGTTFTKWFKIYDGTTAYMFPAVAV